MGDLVTGARGVVVACDVKTLPLLDRLVGTTCGVEGIVGYKVGMTLTERFGLSEVVRRIRQYTAKPVIWDRQKAGTDIPEMGKEFAELAAEAGVDAAIIFPQAGPKTAVSWIEACADMAVRVIVGLHMTHPNYLVSDGGYIADGATESLFSLAANREVKDFVVPGNQPEVVQRCYNYLIPRVGSDLRLYAPGFVKQGGVISDCGKAAGKRWCAIVGSAIYKSEDPGAAVLEMVSQIMGWVPPVGNDA